MLEMKTLCYTKLRNDEFLGLHKKFVEKSKLLTVKEFTPFIEEYGKSVDDYREYVRVTLQESVDSVLHGLDVERKRAYSSCRSFVKTLSVHPDENLRETGLKLRRIFEENSNPTRLNLVQSTGVFDKLLESISREFDETVLVGCGFGPWLDNLKVKVFNYLEYDRERGQKETILTHQNQVLRKKCQDGLTKIVNLCVGRELLEGDECCVSFINGVNVDIEKKKVQLKIRGDRGENKNVENGGEDVAV